ncbi:MAG: hypothetical protein IT356_04195 [Gemmatimonadaceae bacterium]|nr:hypothetical protein [Gemmatimonadaceae bacterium]
MGTGLLDFFALEAGEYSEQIDGALARASGKMPDLEVFTRNARALRGSATMARVDGVARVATGLERLGRGLRDGSLQWTPQLRAAIVAAVDDVKILVRNARTWGSADDERAAARAAELDALAPAFHRRSVVTPIVAVGGSLWVASEAAEIGSGLQRWAGQRTGFDALGDTVRRIRALRGLAALADLPPLKEVVEVVDDAAKSLELGAAPADAHRNLFHAAGNVLREAAEALHAGGKPATTGSAMAAFNSTASLFVARSEDNDYVVPIGTLFPEGDRDNVVFAAPDPPTTPPERFRLEVVSHAEHLRGLVAAARSASADPARQRAAADLRAAARALQRAAESFGEQAVALTMKALVEPAAALELRALDELDRVAAVLAAGRPATPPGTPAAPPTPRAETPPAPAPAAATAFSRATGAIVMPAPTGASLEQALASGLTSLERLSAEPLAEPAIVDEDDGVVPIQELLYRGRAALLRAVEVGAVMKAGGAPGEDALAELFDLLELATTE